ncbi:MAG: 3-isopropylmalate dehydratase small subunit [Rhodospirillaceae bacterium]|jgi:3-isopropylmalate/(R)-2-methylmalate dehydratase small subunit|nr:3-isopropylmalate dehydratase small subunit [Rhodospirillales bacterium]MBT3905546.1 3-isopropylmalate dehydratase small subunit [Rhodospirillaceae bacterium]MBT4702702.1 3-isopropylmalate dehydratase small subunit [Rhodospirillaceae bacterium]MBT5035958.1 3-isopropylmalate dehydratase small subunit [Rhodospirillaceae bacterium]MBT6220742.1 3-isopropylmalate dehydratase small subunit [Rhodospirillaceae bacterium]
MQPFTKLSAVAMPLDRINVDTDQIIPARYLRKSRRHPDYATYLFHDLRFDNDDNEKPEFILNQEPYRKAQIIVADVNFGCGSSREGAVFALAAYGFRSVIAASFGDIHYNNCFKNGVLPIRLDEKTLAGLRAQLFDQPGASIEIDLEAQTVTGPDGSQHAFDIDPFRKRCLLEGLDDIGLTMEHEEKMATFAENYQGNFGWAAPEPA